AIDSRSEDPASDVTSRQPPAYPWYLAPREPIATGAPSLARRALVTPSPLSEIRSVYSLARLPPWSARSRTIHRSWCLFHLGFGFDRGRNPIVVFAPMMPARADVVVGHLFPPL